MWLIFDYINILTQFTKLQKNRLKICTFSDGLNFIYMVGTITFLHNQMGN